MNIFKVCLLRLILSLIIIKLEEREKTKQNGKHPTNNNADDHHHHFFRREEIEINKIENRL